MTIYNNVIEAIGNTPIVRLNRIACGTSANVFAKLEFMNPGGSIKDRIGWYLIEDAEKKGILKERGTIIESTSGNTGFGLAIAAAIKGYKCIFTMPDKMSQEKIKSLRAFGAKVVVTPTAVEPEDPRSYYSVAKRLAKETPNSIYVDQYNNLANRQCHYERTGPEVLKQMPDIDVFIAGIGTGGTICGTGKYLREHKPEVEIVAVDPIGSIVYDKFKTGKDVPAATYIIEGIGEDFIPDNYDFDVITDMVQVEDKESYVMTRELLNKEGLYSGVSSGSAVVGALKWIESQGSRLDGKNILVVLPDSGNRYLSKAFDDDWMLENGFSLNESLGSVEDLMHALGRRAEPVIMASPKDKVTSIIEMMRDKDISQIPIADEDGWIKGVVTETKLLKSIYDGQVKPTGEVGMLADPSIEFIKFTDSIEKVSKVLTEEKTPLVASGESGKEKVVAILTKIDLLTYLGEKSP